MAQSQPSTELVEVRDLTTDDTEELSDEKIKQKLANHLKRSRDVRILLAAADCIDYMNRENHWQSETSVSQSASGNILVDRAADYRRRAAALEPFIQ